MKIEFPEVRSPRPSKATKQAWPTGNVPRPHKTSLDGLRKRKGKKIHRARKAGRMDNGGKWFLASTRESALLLESRFAQELVASVLYQRVGGILQGPSGYVYVQIICQEEHYSLVDGYVEKKVTPADKPEWAVLLALKEIGVYIETAIDLKDIVKSKHF